MNLARKPKLIHDGVPQSLHTVSTQLQPLETFKSSIAGCKRPSFGGALCLGELIFLQQFCRQKISEGPVISIRYRLMTKNRSIVIVHQQNVSEHISITTEASFNSSKFTRTARARRNRRTTLLQRLES